MIAYTSGITQEKEKHVAQIDIDGNTVIKQFSRLGSQEGKSFKNSAYSKSWADSKTPLRIQENQINF